MVSLLQSKFGHVITTDEDEEYNADCPFCSALSALISVYAPGDRHANFYANAFAKVRAYYAQTATEVQFCVPSYVGVVVVVVVVAAVATDIQMSTLCFFHFEAGN